MTQEMKNSEYNFNTARQVVISGIRGMRTRLEMRTKKGQEKYRLAHTTVKARERKKLVARESWYKNQENNETPEKTEYKHGKYKKRKVPSYSLIKNR